ncbi:hypothetical protein OSB04_013542 [Centaurea solstitialis]|uniref:Stress response protein NST1 n=1 Tax=Centaurea solstitialis TaxID=347529 RepID=A0AA38TDH2_9ASTR|nr:hypothetical protein OSB04_013542 [Centaurea solstitialis]
MYERLRKRMPELAHDCQFSGGDTTTTSYGPVSSSSSSSSTGFWSKHRDDVSYNQLQKFWSELSPQARQELLRIDKQTLFEQARKNMYCSRCNGLLLEGFLQIVMYGKSLQQEGAVGQGSGNRLQNSKCHTAEDVCLTIGCNDDVQDPSVHPWGGLTTTRDGTLTLLDCYIYSKYLKGLQNVFDSARARERERELLYPDACGGGGRGWISQGMVGYGRGHGTRETCALHTARLSVETLVDFWSALGEETRYSLLRMKEEDFMERLMYRFDSKRFCRDCRKNVIREFKELKEHKRMRREARCTSWFCVADTSFQYEVTLDTIQADWHQNYADSTGIYQHYEWAVGTGEGKSDILEFENVGLNAGFKAWRFDGRCNEVSVKAHALKGQQCVHCRLVVGDGFVTITRGESIRRFFEHAEEAEEEEDDDSVDKDGNELDGECSRPQKHAKSPELAREFLLDAATVIFKEQVEKAFREGTARQNAHSMFVSLALKLLEERVMVACKDIITLEKQFKLLEEEEKEKRDEEERKERRRAKEKEKKLRRKERLRSKEKDKDKKCHQPSEIPALPDANEQLTIVNEDLNEKIEAYCEEEEDEEEDTLPCIPASEDYIQEEQILNYDETSNAEFSYEKDGNLPFGSDQSKHPRRRLKSWKDYQLDQPSKWSDRRRFMAGSENGSMVGKPGPRFHSDGYETPSRNTNFNGVNKPARRSNGSRYNERLHCSHNRMNSRYDPSDCNCYQHDYRPKTGKPEPDMDVSKPYFRGNKYNNQTEYAREPCGRSKSKIVTGNNAPRSVPDSDDVTDRSATVTEPPVKIVSSSDGTKSAPPDHDDNDSKESKSGIHVEADATSSVSGTTDLSTSSNSNSDSCSSCLSEGNGNTSFSSNPQNPESSSTSDSEYASHHSEVIKETSICLENEFTECGILKVQNTKENENNCKENSGESLSKTAENGKRNDVIGSHPKNVIPPQPLQPQSLHFPVFQAPSMGYYHQGPVPWTTAPTNGLVPLPHPNHYLFASPFGYGLNGGSPFLQYGVGGGQPLGPPVMNHGQVPMYQPGPESNNGVKEQKGKGDENCEGGQNGNSSSRGFSLFHFGGPVDVVSKGGGGFIKPTREEIDVKDVEEYNLFAASNGIKFSFF